MVTRLILNGRVYDYGKPEPSFPTVDSYPLGYIDHPVKDFVDGPWKLRYRLIDRANESDCWLTMPEAKELTKKDEKWLAMKVVAGSIDAAMVRGSSIPLFRIRNRAEIIREALIATPAAPNPEAAVSKRPKKERWDK